MRTSQTLAVLALVLGTFGEAKAITIIDATRTVSAGPLTSPPSSVQTTNALGAFLADAIGFTNFDGASQNSGIQSAADGSSLSITSSDGTNEAGGNLSENTFGAPPYVLTSSLSIEFTVDTNASYTWTDLALLDNFSSITPQSGFFDETANHSVVDLAQARSQTDTGTLVAGHKYSVTMDVQSGQMATWNLGFTVTEASPPPPPPTEAPEPASLGLAGLALLALHARRRALAR